MTARLISVGDDFALPSGVKVADENLPEASRSATVAAAIGLKLDASQKGAGNGVAPLDSTSRVPDANLPARLQSAAFANYATLDSNGKQPVRKGELVINVKDYGAAGDGTTNDAGAIQAALNLAQAGPVRLLFPSGTYVVGQKIYAYSNTDIDLCGSTLRRDFNTGPGGVSLLTINPGSENVTVRNGTLHGNGGTYPGVSGAEGFDIVTANGIRNGLFANLTFRDVVGSHSLDLSGIDGLVVRDCRFLGFKDIVGDRNYAESIQLDPGTFDGGPATNNKNVLITGCYFGPSSTAGFGAPGAGVGNHASVAGRTDMDIRIIGNTFDQCGFAGVRAFRWDNVTIQGNAFLNLPGRGIHVTPFSGSTFAPESGSGYAITGNTFTNVFNPVLFAVPILGPANAYSRFRNVTIAGNTFEGGGDALTLAFITQLAVTGNTFTNVGSCIKLGYTDGAAITGNSLDTTAGNFVWITESFDATLVGTGLTRRTTVTGNVGSNIGLRGVHVNCGAKVTTIVGNTFENVSTAAATRDGITVDSGAAGGIIEGNTILDGGATNKPVYGVSVTTGTNWRVGSNNLYGTTRTLNCGSGTTILTGVVIAGTPEAVLTGAIGSTCTRTDGGASTTFYVKQSGTGNTGWIAK